MAAHPKTYPALGASPKKPSMKKPGIASRRVVTTRTAPREPIAAAKAKTHFLQLLDEVERDRNPITITKRGRVVAQLIPVAASKLSALEQMFGRTKGMMTITGDIVSPDHEFWGPKWR
jgi:prevent-host-death family protein